jgi:hypothetical protein
VNKQQILGAVPQDLKDWRETFKKEVEANSVLLPKMRASLLRKMDEEAVSGLPQFLKRRTNIILYLNDAGDFTETQTYEHEESDQAVALLTPSDFDSEKDCIYCLKTFGATEELQKHYETCAV